MTDIAFDTLKASQNLQMVGIPKEQADAYVSVLMQARNNMVGDPMGNTATRGQVMNLQYALNEIDSTLRRLVERVEALESRIGD